MSTGCIREERGCITNGGASGTITRPIGGAARAHALGRGRGYTTCVISFSLLRGGGDTTRTGEGVHHLRHQLLVVEVERPRHPKAGRRRRPQRADEAQRLSPAPVSTRAAASRWVSQAGQTRRGRHLGRGLAPEPRPLGGIPGAWLFLPSTEDDLEP